MKKLLYILLLISCNAFAQPKFFFRQFDNTIHFGANLQGLNASEEIRFVRDSLKFKYIRYAVTLITYSGGIDNGLQQRYNAGLHVICNLNWSGGGSSGGVKDFPTGATLVTYRAKVVQYLTANKQFLVDGVCIIENEPYNANYFNYDDHQPFQSIVDYINLLNIAIDVCHSFNLKVTDGATHLNYYDDIENPPITRASARRADSAMTYYSTMNLDWGNYHFDSPSNLATSTDMLPDIIKDLTAYGTSRINNNYISNEWHQEASGTSLDESSLAVSIVSRTRQAHIRIALVFGGSPGVDALPLVDNNTLKLTALGIAYRDAVTPNPN